MKPVGQVHFGQSTVPADDREAGGHLVHAFGEDCYVIEDAQSLPPFLTSVASDSDHWLFVASNGGLTAGRRSPATALFPYVTEDKLADSPGVTGPVTSLVATRAGLSALWHPLAECDRLVYRSRQRLYKNVLGTRLVFEEENQDLGLCFRASWRTSDRFGFVRECTLSNRGEGPVAVRLLDGLLNLLPGDADELLQQAYSVLLDAYKQSERFPGSSLAVFTLAAQVVDRPEPREALHATTAWSHGLPGARVHLTAEAHRAFARGAAWPAADSARGQRGAYLRRGRARARPRRRAVLAGGGRRGPHPAGRGPPGRRAPRPRGAGGGAASGHGPRGGAHRTAADRHRRGAADRRPDGLGPPPLQRPLQRPARRRLRPRDRHPGARLRGLRALGQPAAPGRATPPPWPRCPSWSRERPTWPASSALGDPDLDAALARVPAALLQPPARRPEPALEPRSTSGCGTRAAQPVLDYQGNWRDIFQNWEALAPELPGLRRAAWSPSSSTPRPPTGTTPTGSAGTASTGRSPDPGHPWSNIGYWGDHQLVYLLRSSSSRASTTRPRSRPAGAAASSPTPTSPTEFRPYAEIADRTRATPSASTPTAHARIQARAAELGSDGRLLHGEAGLVRVTLVEKLLVPALAKLANFVPGGGHLDEHPAPGVERRQQRAGRLRRVDGDALPPGAVPGDRWPGCSARWPAAARPSRPRSPSGWRRRWRRWRPTGALLGRDVIDDATRGRLMEALGTAAGAYRDTVYQQGFSGRVPVPVDQLLVAGLAGRDLPAPHHLAGAAGGRPLPRLQRAGAPRLRGRLRPAPPRGDAGGSGGGPHLPGRRRRGGLRLLEALRAQPALPRRPAELPALPGPPAARLPGEERHPRGGAAVGAGAGAPAGRRRRPGGAARRRRDGSASRPTSPTPTRCADALRALHARGALPDLGEGEVAAVLEVYEAVFNHRAFTGRSGSMFAYEGLGSIYWHMVGKLLLAVQERYLEAAERGAPAALLERLAAHYQAIRAGHGRRREVPGRLGRLPARRLLPHAGPRRRPAAGHDRAGEGGDPHPPRRARRGGPRRAASRSGPRLLRRSEFLDEPAVFEPLAPDGSRQRLELAAGTLAFTLCQVPVVYHLGDRRRLSVTEADGRTPDRRRHARPGALRGPLPARRPDPSLDVETTPGALSPAWVAPGHAEGLEISCGVEPVACCSRSRSPPWRGAAPVSGTGCPSGSLGCGGACVDPGAADAAQLRRLRQRLRRRDRPA